MLTHNDSTTMAMATQIGRGAVRLWAEALELVKAEGEPIRVGIVGFGRVGARRADCVIRHPGMELRGICDINPQRAAKWPAVSFTTDYNDLVGDDLDAVFVCTYNNFAPDVVVAALKAGKHVFCEKPPGRCVADVERIQAAERASGGRKLKFGFNHRYHGSVMEAKQIVDSGRYGRVLWLRGVYGKCGSIQFENEWRNDREIAGGGILLDQGIHMLDLCRFFCGDFDKVQSLVTTSFWKIPFEDNAFVILSNDSGQVAMIQSSATQWKHEFSLEICMEDGYVHLQGILSSTRSYGDERLTFARKQLEDTTRAFGRPREETIIFDTDDSWRLDVADFAEAIRQDRPITSGNSHDALRVMELIQTIYGNGPSR
jgi:predicted dehydrogenase